LEDGYERLKVQIKRNQKIYAKKGTSEREGNNKTKDG
jgi:hypothetical protein